MEHSSIDNTRMFGDNNAIFGGQFTIAQNVVHSSPATPFELLQQRVATSAFYHSAEDVDTPRCHPDTRVAILERIHTWILQSEFREEWLLWLNGAAGAGKSAIMQSMVERCVKITMSIATFFFRRSDPTRNTIAPLMATLAYQLVQVIPMTSHAIFTTIERNPLIFGQSLEVQLQQLIIDPLLRLPPDLRGLFVVFIDGLDECNNKAHQSNLIKVLGDVSRRKNTPVIFVVASRREAQIEAAFLQKPVADLLHTVPLDEISASDDIRRYIRQKFEDIKETHVRRHLLPPNWPQGSVVEEIVAKSSSQFIFASVVMSYVSSPRANPAAQLEIIRGIRLRHPSSANPFAHLDALYQHIFSQVEALDMVLDIIAYVWLSERYQISEIEDIFLLNTGDVEVFFVDLAALIHCERCTKSHPKLNFLHASLRDFLLDKNRSGQYHIDLNKYRTKVLCTFLERPLQSVDPVLSTHDVEMISAQEWWRLLAIQELLTKAEASEDLRNAFMNFGCSFCTRRLFDGSHSMYEDLLGCLKRLDFQDQGQVYRHVVNTFAREYTRYWDTLVDYGELDQLAPDILSRAREIRRHSI